jgi:VIT1/CCC1 family predicted Fe2+/Mn2+ transporter
MKRGLAKPLATEVVTAFYKQNPLDAHLRDELGYFEHTKARPVQAAVASAVAFTVGGVIPLVGALISKSNQVFYILLFTAIGLTTAGFISAKIAASPLFKTIARIFLGGALGVIITAGIGYLLGLTGI